MVATSSTSQMFSCGRTSELFRESDSRRVGGALMTRPADLPRAVIPHQAFGDARVRALACDEPGEDRRVVESSGALAGWGRGHRNEPPLAGRAPRSRHPLGRDLGEPQA